MEYMNFKNRKYISSNLSKRSKCWIWPTTFPNKTVVLIIFFLFSLFGSCAKRYKQQGLTALRRPRWLTCMLCTRQSGAQPLSHVITPRSHLPCLSLLVNKRRQQGHGEERERLQKLTGRRGGKDPSPNWTPFHPSNRKYLFVVCLFVVFNIKQAIHYLNYSTDP